MTIRVNHQKNYTCITNSAIRDKRLSLKARGLHHLLLSYPDGWQVKIEHLVNESDKDGRTAIASGLRELEDCGYLVRRQTRDPKTGRLGEWETVISEYPLPEKHQTQETCDRSVRKQEVHRQVDRDQETCDIINTVLEEVIKEQEVLIPPLTPQVTPRGEEEILLVAVELVEQEAPAQVAALAKIPAPTQQTDGLLSGTIASARENNSLSRITKPNGSEQFPWEEIDPVKGWGIEGGFLKYLSSAVKDYSQFKDLPLRRFAREVVNYANKAHFDVERKCKLFGYWQDYQEESVCPLPMSELTVSQAIDEIEHQTEIQRIHNASKKKFEL
jgi:hypothetical protein